jgi:hypothetical protein
MKRDATEVYTEKFAEMLKEGLDAHPETSVDPKDEQRSTVGVNHVHDKPEGRTTEWGEDVGDPVQYTDAAIRATNEDRGQLLDRTFDSKPVAERADQALVGQLFVHGVSGDYETHSPLLQPKSHSKLSHVRQPTVRERVRELLK